MNSKAKPVRLKSFEEIVTCLNESFQFGLQRNDFVNPEADLMLSIYCHILNNVMSIENLTQPIVEYTFDQNLRGTDNIEDAIPFFNVYSILKSNDFLIPNITIGDIISPTSKRVQVILSCLLNFFLYSLEKEETNELVNEKFKLNDETKNKMEVERPHLQKLINDAVSKKYNSNCQLQQKYTKRDEFRKLCADAINKKTQIDMEMDFVKKRQAETEQNLAQNDAIREECILKIKDLESKIIESPETLDKSLAELNRKLNQLQCDFNQTAKKSENAKIGATICATWIQEVLDIKDILKSISEQMNENMSNEEEKKKNETDKQRILEEVNESELNLNVITAKKSKIREQNHVNDNKHNLEIASLQSSIDGAKKSLEKLKLDSIERDQNSKGCLEEIETFSAEIASLRSKWQSLEEQFQHSVNSLNESLDTLNLKAESQMKMLLNNIQ